MKKISVVLLSIVSSFSLFAEIKMPSIFGDNMLLQRDVRVKIWGKADANATVDVSFAGQKKSTKADAKGNWSLKLEKMSANKNPQEMTISENGKIGKTIKNILVGEVWFTGGQSNMNWGIYNTDGYKDFAKRANYPAIRYFRQNTCTLTKQPSFDCPKYAMWYDITDAKTAASFSAVGMYFAEKLHLDLDVPVGIIHTALGASKMICWLPEEKMESLPYLKKEWEKFKSGMEKYDYSKAYSKWQKDVADWNERKKLAEEQKKEFKEKSPFEPHKLSCLNLKYQTPVYLYNGVVAPITGYSCRGVIWYQGESDSYGGTLDNFQQQYDLLVQTWREKFENPNLYFIHSQLTSIGKASTWALIRWKQFLSSKSLKNVSVVNIIDLGQKDDVHPRDKDIVGARFANLALEKVYHKKVNAHAPELKSVSYNGDAVKIEFNTFGRKLEMRGEPRGFEVKSNGKWIDAKAVLSSQNVIVKSLNGEKVEGVRYLWKPWAKPDVCLYNQDGLPAFSFINEK